MVCPQNEASQHVWLNLPRMAIGALGWLRNDTGTEVKVRCASYRHLEEVVFRDAARFGCRPVEYTGFWYRLAAGLC